VKPYQRAVVGFLDRIGATAIRIEPPRGSGHPVLSFGWGGRQWRTRIGSSPSDPRAAIFRIRDLRHMLGLVDRVPRIGERRRQRRRWPERHAVSPAPGRRGPRQPVDAPFNAPFARLGERLGMIFR
jgi:hypothetical protein